MLKGPPRKGYRSTTDSFDNSHSEVQTLLDGFLLRAEGVMSCKVSFVSVCAVFFGDPDV